MCKHGHSEDTAVLLTLPWRQHYPLPRACRVPHLQLAVKQEDRAGWWRPQSTLCRCQENRSPLGTCLETRVPLTQAYRSHMVLGWRDNNHNSPAMKANRKSNHQAAHFQYWQLLIWFTFSFSTSNSTSGSWNCVPNHRRPAPKPPGDLPILTTMWVNQTLH